MTDVSDVTDAPDPRAQLPSVTALLQESAIRTAVDDEGRLRVVQALRASLAGAREAATAGDVRSVGRIVDDALDRLASRHQARLRPAVNATGVVLHTNLGRAPLSPAAIAALVDAAGSTNLEMDLGTGARGGRGRACERSLALLCGAEDALVVNNGAAALTLAMATLARDRDVVVSRGELVEIGGSFRLPEILAAAGVRLVEVGTTNRTHVEDYRAAIGPATGAVLRVHPSNYEVVGFAAQPDLREIAEVAGRAGTPLVHDIGSGLLRPPPIEELHGEPTATDALLQGADLVVFSGDKLLGGPQAGAIVGRRDLVDACRRHPLARAMRLDKLRLAALDATLDAHARDDWHELPVWSLLAADPVDLRGRATAIAEQVDAEVVATDAVVGGGASPGAHLASWGIRLSGDTEQLAARLRRGQPPVIGRVIDDSLVLDLRAVPPQDDDRLVEAVVAALRCAGT